MNVHSQRDIDPIETKEWLESLESVIEQEGHERAIYLLQKLLEHTEHASTEGLNELNIFSSAYINTLSETIETPYPGQIDLEKRILSFIRWNAVIMILKAGKYAPSLGGHIASYASAALLYEVGFQHFFHGPNAPQGADLLYIQGHSSPGIYSRAFLEGRLSQDQLGKFRQEVHGAGLSSYPHPWLMPDFWQFPTVSMGLGPLMGIYQARFLKYLQNRKLIQTDLRKIWVFCGDGEMDEPESLGAITLGARENLNNLIFVINCNLQRLDGPVRGNGKIIEELEGIFKGAGWNVLKVIWNSAWDALLAQDSDGLLKKRMKEVLDGEYQNYPVHGAAYFREHFFGKYPELLERVAHLSDEDLLKLERGGHDFQKVYTAYQNAVNQTKRPTVILAKTVKGYGLGKAGEGQNITHQKKKLTSDDLKAFRERFDIPVSDDDIEQLNFVQPSENSPEIQYLKECRQKLGGFLPARRKAADQKLMAPGLDLFSPVLQSTEDRQISTTMAFVRILSILLKHKKLGSRIVPIVPDECRTFGMEGLFRQIGIYSPHGQRYPAEDMQQVMHYREAVDGQILEEGINEAGAFASWIAAATSYSTNNFPMIPFYIYYSMFGFQRIGDLAWAAGDMRARGFLLGATAGRTTLAGEGLQHQDGHSHLISSTIPNCVSYDPTYAYELAVIIQHGLKRMFEQDESVFFYITVMNENYAHPALPEKVEEGILKGMYLFREAPQDAKIKVQLLGCGTIFNEIIKAADVLWKDYSIGADIWSVTSFNELRKEGLEVERHNRLHPEQKAKLSYVTDCLQGRSGLVIAATDYMKIFAEQIRAFIPQSYTVLGTDGFGRSDTRENLRYFFEVDSAAIIYTTLYELSKTGEISMEILKKAQKVFNINSQKTNPVTI